MSPKLTGLEELEWESGPSVLELLVSAVVLPLLLLNDASMASA